jgi:hypothetical protein
MLILFGGTGGAGGGNIAESYFIRTKKVIFAFLPSSMQANALQKSPLRPAFQ